MTTKQVSLYYKDGGSDKVYHAQIKLKDNGYVVDFQYGRRGSTLSTGTKTKDAVDLSSAELAFAKLVKEKMSKGYTEGESGAIFQSQDLGDRITGVVPQLLNVVDEEDVQKYLLSSDWMMQEKFDGRRLMIKKIGDEFTAINKKGLSILIPESVANLVKSVSEDILVDGEIIDEAYYIFDILEYQGKDLRELAVEKRYEILSGIKQLEKNVVTTYFTSEGKEKLFKELKENKKEGVVFKKLGSKYVSGRPASGGNQLKCKFWESATVEVVAHHKTKRSVTVAVYKDNEQIKMGNVTIPSNYDIPDIGSLVEVIYLYCNVGGALYQSKYKGLRDDQDIYDCSYAKLKFKKASDEDDDE